MKTVPKQYRVKSTRVPKTYGVSFRKRMQAATSAKELDQVWNDVGELPLKAHMHLSAAYRRRMSELALDLGPAVVALNANAIEKCAFTGTVEAKS